MLYVLFRAMRMGFRSKRGKRHESGFEQNAEFYALAAREARDEARRLLARIEIVISGLAAKDISAGLELRRSAVEFLVSAGDAQTRRGEISSICGRPSGWQRPFRRVRTDDCRGA